MVVYWVVMMLDPNTRTSCVSLDSLTYIYLYHVAIFAFGDETLHHNTTEQEYLQAVKSVITTDLRLKPSKVQLAGNSSDKYFRSVLDSVPDVGKQLQYFMVTGNLRSST